MNDKHNQGLLSRLKKFSELSGILLVIIGFLVLIAWAFDISILKSPGPEFSTIKTNVGLCFVFIGASLWLMLTKQSDERARRVAQIFAFLAVLIGFLTLCEDLLNLKLGIDQMIFHEAPGALLTFSPNRMAVTVSMSIFFLGLALLLMERNTKWGHQLSQLLIFITGFISLVGLLGHIYGVSALYYFPNYTGMAIYAAVPLLMAVLGLAFAQADKGYLKIMTSKYLGGYLSLRLIPLAVLIPIFLGWLMLLGYRNNFYGPTYGTCLLVVATSITLMLIIWWIARSMNKIDYKREATEAELQKQRDTLEITVEERTKELAKTNELLKAEIKEHKKAETKLEKAVEELGRSNKDLEQFAYIASHDLQEPLRSVSGFLQLLSRRYHGKIDPKADEYINIAVGGANRMQTMIEDLLRFSRVTTKGEKFEPTNFERVLDDVLLNLKATIDENNAIITHDPLPTVRVDESQMKQLFQNLIANAIKFHSEKPPQIHISAEERKGEWIFSVQDNGIGIDPKYAERIFEVFKRLHARRKYSGTGIGLAISRKIVERRGGRIWVDSKPGEGSTFYFTIPKEVSM